MKPTIQTMAESGDIASETGGEASRVISHRESERKETGVKPWRINSVSLTFAF
jgi:hypothetical protein